MDRYSQFENTIRELHTEIVDAIKETLGQKGYHVGDKAYGGRENTVYEIMYDRLLINNSHTDNLSVEELMKAYRDALRMIPNY